MAGPNIIEIVLKASNQASGEFARVEQSMAHLNLTSILRFAGITASVGGTVAMLRKYSLAGAEAEMADVRLAAAMGRVGQYSIQNFNALNAHADAMARMTNADDEEIKRAEALYLSFGVRIGLVEELTKATLEFAAGTTTDLNSAVMLVSRAFINNSESLGRYNAQLTAAAGSSDRVLQIIKFLNTFIGEQRAELDTASGAYGQLGKSMKEWAEITGSTLNLALKPMASWMATHLNDLRDWTGATQQAAKAAEDLGIGWMDVGASMPKFPLPPPTPPPKGKTFEVGFGQVEPQTVGMQTEHGRKMLEVINSLSVSLLLASGDFMNMGHIAESTADAIQAAFDADVARAQQFGSAISGGIANSLVSAAGAGSKFFQVLGQGLLRMTAQIIEMIIQMRIMKALMGSSTFMGWFGLPAMLMAGGGKIPGAYNGILVGGTPGRDSIPIMASPGERVLSKTGNENLERLIGQLASGGGGNQIHIHLGPAIDNESLRYALRYGSLGRELARAGGLG